MAPNYPTMAEYVTAARARAKKRLDEKHPQEQLLYTQQMALVRDAAQMSGIEHWTPNHTLGALFACSAIKGGFDVMHKARMVDHETAEILKMSVEMQEDIIIHLDEDS